MRKDFVAFILTHGRPDRVFTFETLRKSGYRGPLYLVCDTDDPTIPEYKKRYGADKVLTFSKAAIAKAFDEVVPGDRRSIVYARNACFRLAKKLGYRFFIELDDDYSGFYYRFDSKGVYQSIYIRELEPLWSLMCDFLAETPFASVAMSQGGDHIGGINGDALKAIKGKRKAMNTFICDIEKPFQFTGRINEDVNVYTAAQRAGLLFLSFMMAQVNQKQTQSNAGGMTDIYLDSGTYLKSFISVMLAPSCVKVGEVGSSHRRIHHSVDWAACAPCIIPERYRKA